MANCAALRMGVRPRPSGHAVDPLRVHQVHLLKLAADITAAVVSGVPLWRGRAEARLLARYVLLPLGSASAAVLTPTHAGPPR